VGLRASKLRSPAELTSLSGTCPEKQKSAEQNKSSRSAKRKQISASVFKPGGQRCSQQEGQPLSLSAPESFAALGFQAAVRVLTHRLCRVISEDSRQGDRSIEQRIESEPKPFASRTESMANKLRKFGYNEITATNTAPSCMPV
jgi:hypothetical protein